VVITARVSPTDPAYQHAVAEDLHLVSGYVGVGMTL